MADQTTSSSTASPVLVALAGWFIPGTGYLLLGQRARGLTIGISILLLFTLGLLIGGIRCLEVPGFDAHGRKMYYWQTRNGEEVVSHNPPSNPSEVLDLGWTLTQRPVDELRSKPWSIAQVMLGPLDLLCDWWSIRVSPFNVPQGVTAGARSHSRINELGVLYTAVAGMLNLLAIIDSSHRASRTESK